MALAINKCRYSNLAPVSSTLQDRCRVQTRELESRLRKCSVRAYAPTRPRGLTDIGGRARRPTRSCKNPQRNPVHWYKEIIVFAFEHYTGNFG